MAPSLKTLLITLEYPPQVGGVANYYHSLVATHVVPITVATPAELPSSWLKMIPWLYGQIRQHHYSHILVGQVLPLGTVAWLMRKLTGTPYIVFTHGMDILLPQQSVRKRWLLHRILRNAQQIIAASSFTKQQLQQFDQQLPDITVINPAATITPEQSNELVPNLPNQFILSVGRLVERKGFDLVIQALAELPELHYVIAGNGADQTRLLALAQQHGVGERLHIFNNLNNAQLAYLYQQCALLVMPSRQLPNGDVEGFGIVVAEANRFGKTAIGGNAGGMPDAIQDQVTGLLVDPNSVSALVTALQTLWTDTAYRQQLEQAALRWSQQQTWRDRAQQLQSVL